MDASPLGLYYRYTRCEDMHRSYKSSLNMPHGSESEIMSCSFSINFAKGGLIILPYAYFHHLLFNFLAIVIPIECHSFVYIRICV